MKNILLIISHLQSGSDDFLDSLNENERIDLKSNLLSYESPEILQQLYSLGHKLDNTAAIYGGQIIYNKDFSSREFYNFCKFIYIIRSPKATLNLMKRYNPEYSEATACRYYCFRLRRIYEMIHQKRDVLFFTYDELKDSAKTVQDYLELPQPITISLQDFKGEDQISDSILKEAEDCYERYLYQIRNLI